MVTCQSNQQRQEDSPINGAETIVSNLKKVNIQYKCLVN